MLTGHTWVAIQYRLDELAKENVATGYRWLAGKNTRPLCSGSGTVTQSLRRWEPGSDVLIRLIITAVADYAAETTEWRVALTKVQSVDQRMRLGMRCRLSPIADVPSHTSGAGMCPSPNLFDHLVG